MRPWRNRQTRTFEGRVGDRTGSSPVGRTIEKSELIIQISSDFLMYKEPTRLMQESF